MTDFEKCFENKLVDEKDLVLSTQSRETTAAVLILFVQDEGEWNIVYTRRTNGVRTHQGEVSFPGGAYESIDGSLSQTALRETWEEIGIETQCIKILGGLEPVKTISNYLVYPFVGLLNCKVKFKINHDEVEKVFLIPVKWLKDKKNSYEKEYCIDDHIVKNVIHFVDYNGEHLWGLTAWITKCIIDKIN